ncbi:MAG: TonB-dependent receptor [Gammaproteobacteria bacterium]|nr:TonB-dependent receptor [Gammaproteobacteria bacterium]
MPAFAQENAALQGNTSPVEEVIVTGSRIARDPLSTTGPITLLSSEDIQRSGVGTIDELLNQLPSTGTTGINGNDNNGGAGLAFVDLRNLGSARTLVLVNGRRYVSSTSSVASAVDLNNIPVDMIERIEVLTDGASAIYGSDAVAGVINIIMKDSFDGVRISARGGATTEGGGENGEVSFTFGGEGERGKFIANISHNQRDEIPTSDRDWASVTTSSASLNGNISAYGEKFTVAEDGLSLTDGETRLNLSPFTWLSTAVERTSANFAGTFTISDNVEAFGEATYTHKVSNQLLAAQPFTKVGGFEIDPQKNLSQPLQNQLLAKWQRAVINREEWFRDNPGKDSNDNPFQPGENWYDNVSLSIRPLAGGGRASEQTTDTYRIAGGLRGDFSNGWNWETFASYGKNEGENSTANSYNRSRLQAILAGETEVNPVIRGALTPEFLEQFRYTDREDNVYELINLAANLSGDIDAITFQGGALGFAAGVEFRDESGKFNPSEETQSGSSFGNQQDATGGDYSVTEFFTEFKLPLVEELPLIKELTVDAALRYSDFSTFGGQSTGKLGLVYAPIESLRFRASVSNSFRAPGIYELYRGNSQSFEFLVDPCDTSEKNKDGQGAFCNIVPPGFTQDSDQVPTNIGGNSELTPEEATTITGGLVWTPSFTDDLSITVDYFNIEIEDAITSQDLQTVLNDCNRRGIAGACTSITRIDGGEISRLEGALRNLGRIDTSGIDFDITQNLNFNAGRLALRMQATHLLEYEEFDKKTGQTTDLLGKVTEGIGVYTKWRGLASVTWYSDNWDAGIDFEHTGSGETFTEEPTSVSSRTYLNLKAGWNINDALRLSAGVDNLSDQEPQDLTGNGAFASSYDFRGRYAWAGVSYQF